MNKQTLSIFSRMTIVLTLVMVLLAGTASGVQAAGYDDDGIIAEGEVINDDVVLSADDVRMEGTVNGILMAFGNTITISGHVNGDVFAFGNQITIEDDAVIDGNLAVGASIIYVGGEISGSFAGSSSSAVIEDSATIGRNVYYGGYSLEVEPEADINIDLISGAYQVMMDGSVGRDVNIGAGSVDISGIIGRNANIDVGDSVDVQFSSDVDSYDFFSPYMFPLPPGAPAMKDPGLRVDEDAEIGGDLVYTSTVNLSDGFESEPAGDVVFQTPVPSESNESYSYEYDYDPNIRVRFGDTIFGGFITRTLGKFWKNFSTLLILGALAVYFLPKLFRETVDKVRTQPLPSAGYGILSFLGGYIGMVVLFFLILMVSVLLSLFTMGGLRNATFGIGLTGLSLAFAVFLVLVYWGSKLLVSYLVGDWILMKLAPKSENARKPFWGLALGIFLYAILRSIPFLGGFIAFLAIIFGTGAMVLRLIDWRSEPKAGDGVVETAVEVVEAE